METVIGAQLAMAATGRRRRALGALGCVVAVLVGALTISAARGVGAARASAKDSIDLGRALADLGSVHRETVSLAVEVERTRVDAYGDLRAQSARLDDAWLDYDSDLTIRTQRARAANLAAHLAAVHADISVIDETVVAGGLAPVVAGLRQQMHELDSALRRELARQEVERSAAAVNSWAIQRTAALRLLLLAGLAGLAALLALAIARNGLRRRLHADAVELESERRRYRAIVGQVNDAVVEIDAMGRITRCNQAWTALTGVTRATSVGGLLLDHVDEQDRVALARAVLVAAAQGVAARPLELRMRSGSGASRSVELDLLPLSATELSVVIADVTDRVEGAAERDHLVRHDALTGLANRSHLVRQMIEATAQAQRSGGLVAVSFVDLDSFADINDRFGYEVGDDVLREIGDRIQGCLGPHEFAGRLGADQFAIVCNELAGSRLRATQQALAVAERIVHSVRQPLSIDGRDMLVTASVGLAVTVAGDHPAQLLTNSDAACRRAKSCGRARVEIFSDAVRADVARKTTIEHDLRGCGERGELEMWLQPIYSLSDGCLVRLESLLRWRHPRLGLLLPGSFLAIAEERGLVDRLGTWMLWEACTAAHSWSAPDGYLAPGVAVNISGHQLRQDRFAEEVHSVIAATGLPADRLCLEITEAVCASTDERTREALESLHAAGVRLAMDEFGKGDASLTLLRALPIEIVKLSKYVVGELGTEAGDGVLASSVIELGATLGFETVAEGVEAPSQVRRLLELGCGHAQGFLLGRPMPLAAARAVIAGGRIGIDVLAQLGPDEVGPPAAHADTLAQH